MRPLSHPVSEASQEGVSQRLFRGRRRWCSPETITMYCCGFAGSQWGVHSCLLTPVEVKGNNKAPYMHVNVNVELSRADELSYPTRTLW